MTSHHPSRKAIQKKAAQKTTARPIQAPDSSDSDEVSITPTTSSKTGSSRPHAPSRKPVRQKAAQRTIARLTQTLDSSDGDEASIKTGTVLREERRSNTMVSEWSAYMG